MIDTTATNSRRHKSKKALNPSTGARQAIRQRWLRLLIGGTGHFAGVTGGLVGTATTITVEVDPATGTTHSKFASKAVGTLTFPSKL